MELKVFCFSLLACEIWNSLDKEVMDSLQLIALSSYTELEWACFVSVQ